MNQISKRRFTDSKKTPLQEFLNHEKVRQITTTTERDKLTLSEQLEIVILLNHYFKNAAKLRKIFEQRNLENFLEVYSKLVPQEDKEGEMKRIRLFDSSMPLVSEQEGKLNYIYVDKDNVILDSKNKEKFHVGKYFKELEVNLSNKESQTFKINQELFPQEDLPTDKQVEKFTEEISIPSSQVSGENKDGLEPEKVMDSDDKEIPQDNVQDPLETPQGQWSENNQDQVDNDSQSRVIYADAPEKPSSSSESKDKEDKVSENDQALPVGQNLDQNDDKVSSEPKDTVDLDLGQDSIVEDQTEIPKDGDVNSQGKAEDNPQNQDPENISQDAVQNPDPVQPVQNPDPENTSQDQIGEQPGEVTVDPDTPGGGEQDQVNSANEDQISDEDEVDNPTENFDVRIWNQTIKDNFDSEQEIKNMMVTDNYKSFFKVEDSKIVLKEDEEGSKGARQQSYYGASKLEVKEDQITKVEALDFEDFVELWKDDKLSEDERIKNLVHSARDRKRNVDFFIVEEEENNFSYAELIRKVEKSEISFTLKSQKEGPKDILHIVGAKETFPRVSNNLNLEGGYLDQPLASVSLYHTEEGAAVYQDFDFDSPLFGRRIFVTLIRPKTNLNSTDPVDMEREIQERLKEFKSLLKELEPISDDIFDMDDQRQFNFNEAMKEMLFAKKDRIDLKEPRVEIPNTDFYIGRISNKDRLSAVIADDIKKNLASTTWVNRITRGLSGGISGGLIGYYYEQFISVGKRMRFYRILFYSMLVVSAISILALGFLLLR